MRKFLKQLLPDSMLERIRRMRVYKPPKGIIYSPYQPNSVWYAIPKNAPQVVESDEYGQPVPPVELWQGYNSTRERYLAGGKKHVETMLSVLGKTGYEITPGNRVLDFGCGGGRLIRHLAPYAETAEIWGVDIQATLVTWLKQYLEPPFHFATTTLVPHLPFPDGYFTLIYAGSVFTHIDDLTDAWLLELRRLLQPNGRLYFSIHDEATIDALRLAAPQSTVLGLYETYSKLADTPPGMLTVGRETASQVIYDRDWLAAKLSNIFEVLSFTDSGYGRHSTVTVTHRSS